MVMNSSYWVLSFIFWSSNYLKRQKKKKKHANAVVKKRGHEGSAGNWGFCSRHSLESTTDEAANKVSTKSVKEHKSVYCHWEVDAPYECFGL